MDLKMNFRRRMTFKTAVKVATDMTNASISPIFEKFDPVSIGEDYRSYQIASSYGSRLDRVAKNLNHLDGFNALDALLSSYPSHGFVIDFEEAKELFCNVSMPDELMNRVLVSLGRIAYEAQDSTAVVYLNEDFEEALDDANHKTTPEVNDDEGITRAEPVQVDNSARDDNTSQQGAFQAVANDGTEVA